MADPTNLEGAVDCGRNSGSPVSEGDKQTCSPPPPPPPCRDSTGSGGTRRLYLPMDVRLGLLLAGLVLSCLLLYNSADTLKFLQSSHLSSISRGAAVRSIPPLLVRQIQVQVDNSLKSFSPSWIFFFTSIILLIHTWNKTLTILYNDIFNHYYGIVMNFDFLGIKQGHNIN